MLGPYDAIYLLGSAGCGKSKALRDVHVLAQASVGVDGAAHCANSGRIAVNVGGRCTTFGRRLRNGHHRASETHGYMDVRVAREVASIKVLMVEEATSIAPRVFSEHMSKLKDAKELVNSAVAALGKPAEFPEVGSAVHGVRLLASGDYLQKIIASGGVGRVDDTGRYSPYVPPAAAGYEPWHLEALQHPYARVLFLVGHGNCRLRSKMFELFSTGCAGTSIAACCLL